VDNKRSTDKNSTDKSSTDKTVQKQPITQVPDGIVNKKVYSIRTIYSTVSNNDGKRCQPQALGTKSAAGTEKATGRYRKGSQQHGHSRHQAM
jgi:hypothetical protein